MSLFPAEVKKKVKQKAEYFDSLCSVFYASNKTDGTARHRWRCTCFCLWWCPTLSDLYSAGRGLAQEITSSDMVSPPVCTLVDVVGSDDLQTQHYNTLQNTTNFEVRIGRDVTVIFIILTVKRNVMCRSRGMWIWMSGLEMSSSWHWTSATFTQPIRLMQDLSLP